MLKSIKVKQREVKQEQTSRKERGLVVKVEEKRKPTVCKGAIGRFIVAPQSISKI